MMLCIETTRITTKVIVRRKLERTNKSLIFLNVPCTHAIVQICELKLDFFNYLKQTEEIS